MSQANVQQYYQQFEEQQIQSLIDQEVKELVSNGGSICTTTNRGCISPKFGNPAVWSVQSHSLPLECHKACI